MSNSLRPHGLQHAKASLSIANSQSLLKLMSVESMMPSNHFILCGLLLLLPSIFPSIRVFSSESVLCIRWPKCWSFSFSISPSSEYSGLISFRMDWLDLLAGQGTLKSLLQHHSSKASSLRRSAFFMVQLSHPYMTTGKTIQQLHTWAGTECRGEKSYWLQEGEEVGDGRAEGSLAIGDGGASFDLTHIWHWWKVLGLK